MSAEVPRRDEIEKVSEVELCFVDYYPWGGFFFLELLCFCFLRAVSLLFGFSFQEMVDLVDAAIHARYGMCSAALCRQ
jgi:hypothetical protein